jgi:hypothetical protein
LGIIGYFETSNYCHLPDNQNNSDNFSLGILRYFTTQSANRNVGIWRYFHHSITTASLRGTKQSPTVQSESKCRYLSVFHHSITTRHCEVRSNPQLYRADRNVGIFTTPSPRLIARYEAIPDCTERIEMSVFVGIFKILIPASTRPFRRPRLNTNSCERLRSRALHG